MNTCEVCGQRVQVNDSKLVTRYYIPWCENEIKRLEEELDNFKNFTDSIVEINKKILPGEVDSGYAMVKHLSDLKKENESLVMDKKHLRSLLDEKDALNLRRFQEIGELENKLTKAMAIIDFLKKENEILRK